MSKIGLVIPYWSNITKNEIINFGKLAENLGYDSIWVPEMWGRDAFTILSLLAANTRKVKLGTGIISVYSRTPAVIAQTIATLDEITEGRMILGLGTSGPVVIENWHGIEFEKPLRRTREYVDIIRLILSGGKVNYDGEILKLKNFRLQFKPFRANIPIYIASLGPKNIHLTGEIADGWIPFLTPVDYLKKEKHNLITSAQKSGRDPDQISICPYIPALISEDNELSKELIKEYIAYYIGGMGTYYYNLFCRWGFENDANSVVQAWEKGSKSEAIQSISDELINAVAIWGSHIKGKRKIEEYTKINITLPILIFPPKSSREIVRETITRLAPKN